MTKEVDEANAKGYAEGFAAGVSANTDTFVGTGHGRTTSNVDARTTKDADRSDTTSFSMPRLDSDVDTSEGWAVFNLEVARRDRVHFDNAAFDSRRHGNEAAKHEAALWAQILDAQKLGTNNMWTTSDEIAQVVLAKIADVLNPKK